MIEFKIGLTPAGKSVASKVDGYVQGLLLLCGLLMVAYSFYIMWRPLGYLVGGISLMGVGLLMNKLSEQK